MRPGLKPAFEGRVEVSSVLYRKGSLYLDLSEEAALEDPAALVLGLQALRRSLSAGLPGVGRIVLTIGGMEPYAEGLANDAQAAKKSKKN
jgi:hypothetical protein